VKNIEKILQGVAELMEFQGDFFKAIIGRL
jgi:hypothetical protein